MLELSQSEVKHIWDCLHAWADEQVAAFVAQERQTEEGTLGCGEAAASDPDNTDKVEAASKFCTVCVCVCLALNGLLSSPWKYK